MLKKRTVKFHLLIICFNFACPFGGELGSDGRVARQRSAKPFTAVRIRFRPRIKANDKYIMAVTRLKRKDRRNKVTAKAEVQFLKLGRNIETGSRSKMSPRNQIVKNDAVLNQLEAELNK